MKLLYIIVLVSLFLVASASSEASEWTKSNTKWESAYMVTHLIDWRQTLEISNNPRFKETNPILGNNPTENEINQYFLLTGISHYLISRYLDDWRETWQKTTFFIQFSVISKNAIIGIKTNF